MSNSKKSAAKSEAKAQSAAEAKKLSKAEREARTTENKAKNLAKQPETAEQKTARRLASFLAENGQALADAGIDTSGKTKPQLIAELEAYRASLLTQAKTEARASVKGFDPQALAAAEEAVEANPPQSAADMQMQKTAKGLAVLQTLVVSDDYELPMDEIGEAVAPTEEVSLPQQEATIVEEIDEPKEAVTMTYKNNEEQILTVVPDTYASVKEAIDAAVQAAYQPDMAKVQQVYDSTFNSSKSLLERAIDRMRAEAEDKFGKAEEERLIAEAEASAEEDAIAQVLVDNPDLGLTEEMVRSLLEEERKAEETKKAAAEAAKAEQARQKAHARKQRELLTEAKADGMLDDAKKLAEELETLTKVSNAGALAGAAEKIEQLAAAGKLTQPAVSNFVGQYKKAYKTWKSLTRVAPAAPVKKTEKQQQASI